MGEDVNKTPLILYHKHGVDNHGIFRITGFPFEKPLIYKAKKFACRSLKGKGVRSGIRVIYAYFEKEDRIELIEIYYKDSVQKCEDKEQILSIYVEVVAGG